MLNLLHAFYLTPAATGFGHMADGAAEAYLRAQHVALSTRRSKYGPNETVLSMMLQNNTFAVAVCVW